MFRMEKEEREGWIEMEETNGHFMKHKTLALQRNTMPNSLKRSGDV